MVLQQPLFCAAGALSFDCSALHLKAIWRACHTLPDETTAASCVDMILIGCPVALIVTVSVTSAAARHHVLADARDWASSAVLEDTNPSAACWRDFSSSRMHDGEQMHPLPTNVPCSSSGETSAPPLLMADETLALRIYSRLYPKAYDN